MFRVLLCFLMAAASLGIANAQEWALSGGADAPPKPISMVFDADGNMFVAGITVDTIDFGNNVIIVPMSATNSNSYIAKYNSEKQCVWAKCLTGTNKNSIQNIAVDAYGNVFAAGIFDRFMNFHNGVSLTATGDNDGFAVKYNSDGECLWANLQDRNPQHHRTARIACDAVGNSYVLGDFSFFVSFGNGVSLSYDKYDMSVDYLVKYDPTGKLQWAKLLDSTAGLDAGCLAVGAMGDIYVAGSYRNTMTLGNGKSLISLKKSNSCLIKYNTSGECQWASGLSGKAINYAKTVAVDSIGNVYLSGKFYDSLALGNNKYLFAVDASYIAKYNSAGTCQWATSCINASADNSIAVDALGNSYLFSGYTQNTTIDNTISMTANYSGTFIAKFNPYGKCIWADNLIMRSGNFENHCIAIDPLGSPFVAGNCYSSILYLPNERRINSANKAFILKFNTEALIVPSPNSPLFISEGINLNTYLNWHPINDATGYKVQVSARQDFTTLLVEKSIQDTTIDLSNLMYHKEYYWRIQSLKNTDTSEWSPAWHFTTVYEPEANVWAQKLNIEISNDEIITVDSNGVFYVGSGWGTAARYDLSNKYQWVQSFDITNGDIKAIATDASGNSYFAGDFKDTLQLGNSQVLKSPGNFNGFITKYNSANECIWARSLGGAYFDQATGVAVDAQGSMFVCGFFHDTMALGNNIYLVANSSKNGFIVKYNSSGTCEWARKLDSTEWISKLVLGANGNIYIAGTYRNEISFGNEVKLNNTGNAAGFIAKFNTQGECLMAKSLDASNGDVVVKNIAVDTDENIYIVGVFNGTIELTNNESLTSAGSKDAFVVKYNSMGECQWAKRFGDETEYDIAKSVAVDSQGYVYVAGHYIGTINLGNGVVLNGVALNPGEKKIGVACLIKLNSDGKCIYAENLSSDFAGNSSAYNVVVDNKDNAYVTGYFANKLNLDYGISLSVSSSYVLKYKAQYTLPPVLTAPDLDSTITDLNANLNWVAVNSESGYRVQVSTTNDFAAPIVNEVVSSTTINPSDLQYNTKYFWRVKSITDKDSTVWSPTWSFTTVDPAEVAESNNTFFSISPQPVKDEAIISFNAGTTNAGISIELYDLKGTLVATYNFSLLNEGSNKLRLDLSNLPSGMYNAVIKNGAEVHNAKLIKAE